MTLPGFRLRVDAPRQKQPVRCDDERQLAYPELLTGIDRLIDDRDVPLTPRLGREEALQMIVRDWLQGQRLCRVARWRESHPRHCSLQSPQRCLSASKT